MILRRLAQAVRRQDWFTVVIEFVIVVFGVFIGLQVDNWNGARADAARRDQINEALIVYLVDATNVLEAFIERIAGVQLEAGAWAVDQSDSENAATRHSSLLRTRPLRASGTTSWTPLEWRSHANLT